MFDRPMGQSTQKGACDGTERADMSGRTKARKYRKNPYGNSYGLPEMPRMKTASDYRPRELITIPGDPNLDVVTGAEWGGTTAGRYVGGGKMTNVMGVCDVCGQLVRAWHLMYVDRPFGLGEIRKCRGGCE